MFKNYVREHKTVVLIITIVILALAGGLGYNMYQDKIKKEDIAQYQNKINKISQQFDKEQDDSKKMQNLDHLLKDFQKYKKSNKDYSEINKLYNSKILKMKKYFKDSYDQSIKDNTLQEVEKISDKNQLNTASANLNKLLETIRSKENISLTDKEKNTYETNIQNLVNTYNSRVQAIEAEEQRKVAEEVAKKSQSSSGSSSSSSSGNKKSSSSSSSSSNRGSSSSSSSSSNWKNGKTYYKAWDENGNTEEWYEDSNGNKYDMNGNYIGRMDY